MAFALVPKLRLGTFSRKLCFPMPAPALRRCLYTSLAVFDTIPVSVSSI